MSHDQRRADIIEYLAQNPDSTSMDLADFCGAKLGNMQNLLWRMTQDGIIRAKNIRGRNRAGKSVLVRVYHLPNLSFIPMLRPSGYRLVREMERERLCAGQSTY